jgi:prepilin-type N-terminal cleavage/methylation domain-containing protein
MDSTLKISKGVTLIELLIALVLSSILIAALYRVFISQQKTYTVQEQVVDMQQNARVGINRMMSEIRMAGFGNVGDVLGLPADMNGVKGVNGFTQVVTPGPNTITLVGGFKQIRRDNGDPILISSASGNTITLNYATDEFDRPAHRFISIGGVESSTVLQRDVRVLTLSSSLKFNHRPDLYPIPIFKIQAITYTTEVSDDFKPVLYRNENTGGNRQPLADNIENIQFEYFFYDKVNDKETKLDLPITNPGIIQMVKVTVNAMTDMEDPKLKDVMKDGYRRRQIASNIYLRNMGQSP